jgi:hypothetical protein
MSIDRLGVVVTRAFVCLTLVVCAVWLRGGEPPVGAKSIGGHWWCQEGDKPTYFYEDAGEYVDLFSYHILDSNKDGIANLILSHDERFLIIKSQGYPNHPTAKFPNSGNPNSIKVQDFTFRIALKPEKSDVITRVPMGPIGFALNGVVFFNPFEMGGMNAVAGYSEVWLDSCCGHPQQTGVYHYHKYPSCVKSPFPDDGVRHSPIIGFAFDGFPIYGPYETKGLMAKDIKEGNVLDVCNGHEDSERGYHYHVTPGRFPYVIGGYAGIPEATNNRGLRRAGEGAIKDNAEGESRIEGVISRVTPGNLIKGTKAQVLIELQPDKIRRGTMPEAPPSWSQIGPYEAVSMSREGNSIKAEFEIPEDANLGVLLDLHMEFEAPGRPIRVFKMNDAARVTKQSDE